MENNIDEMMKNAISAERSKLYVEVEKIFDEAIKIEPNRPDVVIGKAFVNLSKTVNDKLDIETFEKELLEGISLVDEKDILLYHALIMDKSWSIMPYLLENIVNDFINSVNVNVPMSSEKFIENLILMHNVQMFISNIVDEKLEKNDFNIKLGNGYIQAYIELKKTIVSHGKYLIDSAKKYKVKIDKETLKEIKNSIKVNNKKLKVFVKQYC